MPSFLERLELSSESNRSLLCVGLDPDPASVAISDILEFNKVVIDATKDLVCAYKPNLAYYDALGTSGLEVLHATVAHIREVAPRVVVIGDAKRGDIGSTNEAHARAMFEVWGFDAVTVNAYAGLEVLEPFVEYLDRGVFIWCRSSNTLSGLQDVRVGSGCGPRLFEWLAAQVSGWDKYGNVGLIAGATYPVDIETIRSICPEMPLLVPGVGAQEGDLGRSVAAGVDHSGRRLVVSSSRGVLYASRSPEGFDLAVRTAAKKIRDRINDTLSSEGKGWSKI